MITERTGVIQTLPGNVGVVAEDILNELAEEMTGTESASDTQNRRRNIRS